MLVMCEELRERGRTLIRGFTSTPDVRSVIIAGTLGRATASWGLIISLVGDGHGPQAAMLLRSLFEDVEVAHWTVTYRGEDQALHRLFDDHDELQNLRLARLGDATAPDYMADERAEDLWRRYGKNPGAHWTRRSQSARLRAVQSAWWGQRAHRDQIDLLMQTGRMVEVWSNAMLHHGPWALRPFISPDDEDGSWIISTGKTWHRGWASLDLGYMSYGLLLYLAADRFSSSPPVSLREFLSTAEEVRRLRVELADQEARRERALKDDPPPRL